MDDTIAAAPLRLPSIARLGEQHAAGQEKQSSESREAYNVF